MNRLQAALSLSLLSVAALTGCSGFGAASFPDASANPAQIPLGSIQGSDFGGHAPLVGAHVYVLQPSVTTGGGTSTQTAQANAYAGRASSLLSATYSNNGSNYPATIQNASDPGIPTSWYYLQTDQTGAFNITGDYTCTAGLPVYLYLYGGSPTYPSGSTTATNTYPISNIVYNAAASGGGYNVTMTINTAAANPIENAYIGEGFTVTSTTSTNPSASLFNGSFQTVLANNLTTTTFSFYQPALATGATVGTNYPQTGTNMQVTFEPTFNPAVVNLAVLGNCPSSGSFTGANKISYVYVNEVATVAAAYAFRPFTFTPLSGTQGYQTDCATTYVTNTSTLATTTYDWNNATCIGTSSTNIAGLQNAANLAGQLYDITGSNISTTYAGEGHIARSATTAGNGIVPQANINTIANILAACVDSNNGATLVGSTGSYNNTTQGAYTAISGQCTALFTAATSNGIPIGATGAGIQPFDIAQAAINIARYPAGPTYSYSTSGSTTFVNNLYTLPNAGNRPFEPDLLSTGAGQPNDFSLAIYYTAANNPGPHSFELTTGSESVAVDQIGNAWFTTQPNKGSGAGYFFEMSPTGVASNIQYNSSYIYGYVTIDSGNSAWAGAEINGDSAVTYVHNTGTSTSTAVYPQPYTYATGATNSTLVENYTTAAVSSYTGNVFFANNSTPGTSTNYIQSFAGAATSPGVTAKQSAAIPSVSNSGNGFSHGAMYFGGANAYFSYNAASGVGTPVVDYVSLSTTSGYTPVNGSGFPVTNATTGCTAMLNPEQIATLRSGDVIVPDYHNGTGVVTGTGSALYYITSPAGAGTAGTATGPGGCTQIPESTFHAGLNYPFGSAVDGNDFVYVTNRGGSSISIFDARTAGAANLVSVSPSTGIVPQYVVGGTLTAMLGNPLNIATGPEGSIWISDYGNNTITEIIGLAYPTTTPLGNAAIPTPVPFTSGSIGYRP